MNHESLLDTIRRLLALSKSPNEHEAQLAAAKAAELMRLHNLSASEIVEESEWTSEVGSSHKRVGMEVHLVADLLHEHFFVKCYLDNDYRVVGGRHRKVLSRLRIFGRRENVAVAVYVYQVLLRTFRALAKQDLERRGYQESSAAYLVGLRDGFSRAMRKERGRRTHAENTLIVKHRAAIEQALVRHGVKIGGSARRVDVDPDAESYLRGHLDGEKIKVHTPLPGEDAAPRLLT